MKMESVHFQTTNEKVAQAEMIKTMNAVSNSLDVFVTFYDGDCFMGWNHENPMTGCKFI